MRHTLQTVAFLGIAVVLSVHCYRSLIPSIDMLSYGGNVALNVTPDLEEVHRMVYREMQSPHLLGTDSSDGQALTLRKRATDPYYSALYLPYFSVKPLYVMTLSLLHKAGLGLMDSSRLISTLSYFGMAVLAWYSTGSWLSLVVLILPEFMMLGEATEPDAMSVLFLLVGLFALFLEQEDFGIAPLVASVWIRPDNLILVLVVLSWLLLSGRFKLNVSVPLGLLSVASVVLISHYGYGWKALYFHTFLGGGPEGVAKFAAADYVRALSSGTKTMLHGAVPIYGLMWLAAFSLAWETKVREVLALSAVYSVLRFLVFPSYEPRYYGLFFLSTAICVILVASRDTRLPSQMKRRATAHLEA
jgi:hypothetical protein